MASQMQQHSHHRRNSAGQGIVVRPSAAKGECRYCRETGHHIYTWDKQTRSKVLTCPKLIAKQDRQRRPRRRDTGSKLSGSSSMKLGGWVTRAEKEGRFQAKFVKQSKPIHRHAAVTTTNRFSALSTELAWGVKVEIRAPKVVRAAAPHSVWASSTALHSSIASVVEREETARALGLVAVHIKEEKAAQPATPLVILSKNVRFAGDSNTLMKPPCETKVFAAEDPPSSIAAPDQKLAKLVIGKNAWRPKARRAVPSASDAICCAAASRCAEREVFTRKLLAQKEKALDELKEEGSWADCEEQEELEETVAQLKAQLAAGCCLSRN